MKKKITFVLLLGALCASVFAGCGTDNTVSSEAEDTESSREIVVSSEAVSSEETPTESEASSEEAVSSEEPAAEVPTVTVALDDVDGENVAYILKLTGVDNEAVEAINSKIDELIDEYNTATQGPQWAEFYGSAESDEQYINLTVYHNTYPTYGIQGTIDGFTYDIANAAYLTPAEALAKVGVSTSDLKKQFTSYYADRAEGNEYRTITDFTVTACLLFADGSGDVYFSVTTEPGDDTPDEYLTGSSQEIYHYNTATNTFSWAALREGEVEDAVG
jgi:hypothetical protein